MRRATKNTVLATFMDEIGLGVEHRRKVRYLLRRRRFDDLHRYARQQRARAAIKEAVARNRREKQWRNDR